MTKYWIDWALDVGLVLVVAVVLWGGSWVVYKLVRAVMRAWDEDTTGDGGD